MLDIIKSRTGKKKISALCLVLAVSALLNLVGFWWGLPGHMGWAPDELIPSLVLRGMDQFYSKGWSSKYPPFHFYLLSLLFLPFWLLHRLRVLDVNNLSVYAVLFYLTRVLSLVMGTAMVYLVYRCGREIYDRRAALFASLITAFMVPVVYYSKTANLDIPYMFWLLWSLYFFFRALKTGRTKTYLLFALTATLAVCTKDQAAGFYIAAPLFLIWSDWRRQRQAGRQRSFLRLIGSRKYLLSAAIALILFLLVHNVLLNGPSVLNRFLRFFQRAVDSPPHPYQIVPRSLVGHAQLFGITLSQIQGCLGWPLFAVCLAGLLWSLVQKKKNFPLWAGLGLAISYYVFFINFILFNYARFNLPICVILAFFGGQLLAAWMGARQPSLWIRQTAVALVFLFSFLNAASVDVLMLRDSRYAVERWMQAQIPRQTVIGVIAPVQYSVRPRGFQWKVLTPSLDFFNTIHKPEYVVINRDFARRFAPGTKATWFFSSFHIQEERYEPVFELKPRLPWYVWNAPFIMAQINIINPEIQVFKKVVPPR